MLYEVLHDLDDIITEATDPKTKLNIEEIQNRRQDRISRSENREMQEYFKNGTRMIKMKDSMKPENLRASFHSFFFEKEKHSKKVIRSKNF